MDEISQVKQNLDIIDIISGYIELKKAGRNYKGICPFHSEKTPSFMVTPELQIYKCFGCGKGGDVISFVQEIEGIDFAQALEKLAEKAGVKLKKKNFDSKSKEKKLLYKINEDAAAFYIRLLNHKKIGKLGQIYLTKERKLSKEAIKEFQIGFIPDSWNLLFKFLTEKRNYKAEDIVKAGLAVRKKSKTGYFDKFRGRIMFPITGIDEKIVGFTGRSLFDQDPKYLNTQETLIFQKSSLLYGLNKAKIDIKKMGAVFVEGQMDVISAHQANIKNVIASSGTALTLNHLKLLARYTKDITFCFDPDQAGRAATLRAIELAEGQNFNIKVAIIPQKYADLDELIKVSKTDAKKIIKNAVPIYDFFLANSFKNFDKTTAIGKKKIMTDLAPKLSTISNTVVLNHYIKTLASEINIDENVLLDIIKNAKSDIYNKKIEDSLREQQKTKGEKVNKTSEEYLLALLFSAELEITQNILYKLGKNDFQNIITQEIFTAFKQYVTGRKRKFEIKYFSDKLDDNLKDTVQKIHLWDLGNLTEDTRALQQELNKALARIKSESITRKLDTLIKELKQAELENNKDKEAALSEKVNKLLKQKGVYEN